MAKIIRAMKHYKLVEDCIADYASRKPYREIPQPDGIPTLELTETPPIDIAIFAGEILYQLRSALDHFFFDLIERNGPPLTSKQMRSCGFPLRTERPLEAAGPIGKTDLLRDYQLRIPHDAFTLIEGLQPYNRIHHGHTLLRMLAIFSNIDKHRRLASTILKINREHTVVSTNGIKSTMTMMMLDAGAKLHGVVHPWLKAESIVDVKEKHTLVIAFDEPEFGPPQTAVIEELIYELPTFVWQIGLNFKKFLC